MKSYIWSYNGIKIFLVIGTTGKGRYLTLTQNLVLLPISLSLSLYRSFSLSLPPSLYWRHGVFSPHISLSICHSLPHYIDSSPTTGRLDFIFLPDSLLSMPHSLTHSLTLSLSLSLTPLVLLLLSLTEMTPPLSTGLNNWSQKRANRETVTYLSCAGRWISNIWHRGVVMRDCVRFWLLWMNEWSSIWETGVWVKWYKWRPVTMCIIYCTVLPPHPNTIKWAGARERAKNGLGPNSPKPMAPLVSVPRPAHCLRTLCI